MTLKQKIKYWLLLPFAYYTKIERLRIYELARKRQLEMMENKVGLCWLIAAYKDNSLVINLKGFPEVYCQRPKTAKSFWFSYYDKEANNKRIAILDQAIKMCK